MPIHASLFSSHSSHSLPSSRPQRRAWLIPTLLFSTITPHRSLAMAAQTALTSPTSMREPANDHAIFNEASFKDLQRIQPGEPLHELFDGPLEAPFEAPVTAPTAETSSAETSSAETSSAETSPTKPIASPESDNMPLKLSVSLFLLLVARAIIKRHPSLQTHLPQRLRSTPIITPSREDQRIMLRNHHVAIIDSLLSLQLAAQDNFWHHFPRDTPYKELTPKRLIKQLEVAAPLLEAIGDYVDQHIAEPEHSKMMERFFDEIEYKPFCYPVGLPMKDHNNEPLLNEHNEPKYEYYDLPTLLKYAHLNRSAHIGTSDFKSYTTGIRSFEELQRAPEKSVIQLLYTLFKDEDDLANIITAIKPDATNQQIDALATLICGLKSPPHSTHEFSVDQ